MSLSGAIRGTRSSEHVSWVREAGIRNTGMGIDQEVGRHMTASVSDEFEIEATPEQVMRALTDIERIPEWSSSHKDVQVESRHDDGRPRVVRMTLALFGISDTQVIEHEWTEESTSWTLLESEMQHSQDGEYLLTRTERGTCVRVTMSTDPKIPVPGFMLRQGQKHAIKTIRKGLTEFVLRHYA